MARSLIRLREVMHKSGLSRTAIYDAMRAGTFPQSVPIGARTIGWIEDEVDAWIEGRITAGRQPNRPRKRAVPHRARDAKRAAAIPA